MEQKESKKEEKTVLAAVDEEKKEQPKRNPIRAFCIGVGMPGFVIWLAWALYPILYHKDVLAGMHDFSDCTVL